jgi:gamma-glutamylcysteine synthetase
MKNKPEKKYYIITKSEKKVYFRQANASDFTQHKDEKDVKDILKGMRKTKLNFGIKF